MSKLKFRSTKRHPSEVGKQPSSGRRVSPRPPSRPASLELTFDSEIEFLKERKEYEKEEDQDAIDERIGPIASANLSPATFQTTAVTPQSTESYSPDDPRANPVVAASPGATGGFLPAPPIA
jgi:hypothetical protein